MMMNLSVLCMFVMCPVIVDVGKLKVTIDVRLKEHLAVRLKES